MMMNLNLRSDVELSRYVSYPIWYLLTRDGVETRNRVDIPGRVEEEEPGRRRTRTVKWCLG
jgi:hypothetical protein